MTNPVIDLSANENPLGPSPRVARAIVAQLRRLHRYPDRDGSELTAALARKLGVHSGQIVLGNGSCEILDLAARAHLGPGDEAIIAVPSFPPYQSCVERARACKIMVPLREHRHDFEAMLHKITARTRLIIIGNPNNPTGTTADAQALGRFLELIPDRVLVVLDEAYFEYVRREDFPEALQFVSRGRPVLITRSLSKAYGLAGLRLGYGVASARVAQRLKAMRQHYNVNSLAQTAAGAALEDEQHLRRCVEHNTAGRSYLRREIHALGLECPRSEANFLLVKVGDGREVCRMLERRGILVKGMAGFGLPEHIRVSVGSDEDNERFIGALREIWHACV